MYILVCPFWKTFDDIWLTYFVSDFFISEIKVGQIIEIPLKDMVELWVVLKLDIKISEEYDESKIKSIISIKNSNIFLNLYRTELITWIAKNYFTPIHNSLNLFFPKNLKEKILKDKLIFPEVILDSYNYNTNVKLTINQEKSYNEIINSDNNKILFYWLTWSWKTEIYIKLIQDYILKWQQVLFLIPEIILTNQLSEKIIKIFWKEVIVLNSTVTDANKTKYWISINNNESKVIIWTRSALFYPYNNLWLVIIDEEHDGSYISDSAPRYKAIEVAEKITELNWNKLLLASWTPSVESMYNWVKWKYKIVNLIEKYTK